MDIQNFICNFRVWLLYRTNIWCFLKKNNVNWHNLVYSVLARILSGLGANSEKGIFTHDYLYQKGHLIYM